MNKIDLFILLLILIFMLVGYYRGLVKSILSAVQYVLVIVFAVCLSPIFSEILIEKFNLDVVIIEWIKNSKNLLQDTLSIVSEEIIEAFTIRIINVIAIVSLFIILKIITSLLIRILNKVANLPIISVVNKFGGLALGAINGVLLAYLLILLINWLPLESLEFIKSETSESYLGSMISSYVPKVATEVVSGIKTSV